MSPRTHTRPERARRTADILAPLGSVLQEQDSRRLDLAQRLHRDVAGGLVASVSLSEMIRHDMDHGVAHDALGAMLRNLETTLRQTLQVVRDLTGEQLPAVLKTFGLGCALQQLAENTAGTRCPVEMAVTGEEPAIPISQRLSLHQIIQSLIHRIRQHADASGIDVVCLFDPARAEILIEHDGKDVMNPQSPDDATLPAIKGRIALLGARLLVSHDAASGLRRVRLVVPLPVKADDLPTTKSTPQPASLP